MVHSAAGMILRMNGRWAWQCFLLMFLASLSASKKNHLDKDFKAYPDVVFMSRKAPSPEENLTGSVIVSDKPRNSGRFIDIGEIRDNETECRDVKYINASFKCEFVQETSACQNDEGFINYNEFIFCQFDFHLVGLAVFILLILWLYLFAGLAVTADLFFCPSLVEIAKCLRMSDNIAGVTLLAFGNGAPDVFSAIAAVGSMKNGDAGLAIGALFGAGIFVTTVVAGAVSVTKPFEAMQRPLLRDIIFYIAAVFFVFYILYSRTVTLGQTIGFLGLYLFYVCVVVVGRYIYQRRKRSLACPSSSPDPIGDGEPIDDHVGVINSHTRPDHAIRSLAEVAEHLSIATAFAHDLIENEETHLPSIISEIEDDENASLLKLHVEPQSSCRQFLHTINPVDIENWSSLGWCSKAVEIFKAPVVFILKICIPVVDHDGELDGWNKPLRLINIMVGPIIAVFGANSSFALLYIGNVFPVWALVLALSYLLTALVFFTSVPDRKPVYHTAFAFAGFIISVIWISGIAKEIVNLLQALGVVMNISDAVLGLTLLAWGNSIGDLIADISMARQGFPRTAISACFGGPLFNLLVGLGIPFTIKIISVRHSLQLKFTLIQVVLVTGLFVSLLSTLIVIPLLKFHFKRGYGIYLFSLYAVFLVFVALVEFGLITAQF